MAAAGACLSVNLSGFQLSAALPESWWPSSSRGVSGVDAGLLTLELAETVLMLT